MVKVVVGYVHTRCCGIGQWPGSAQNGQAGGNAVEDVQIAEVDAGNAAVIVHDNLNRRTPAVTAVIPPATYHIAPLGDVRAAEGERYRKRGAEQDAAAV